jgi:hypothetical protein
MIGWIEIARPPFASSMHVTIDGHAAVFGAPIATCVGDRTVVIRALTRSEETVVDATISMVVPVTSQRTTRVALPSLRL